MGPLFFDQGMEAQMRLFYTEESEDFGIQKNP